VRYEASFNVNCFREMDRRPAAEVYIGGFSRSTAMGEFFTIATQLNPILRARFRKEDVTSRCGPGTASLTTRAPCSPWSVTAQECCRSLARFEPSEAHVLHQAQAPRQFFTVRATAFAHTNAPMEKGFAFCNARRGGQMRRNGSGVLQRQVITAAWTGAS